MAYHDYSPYTLPTIDFVGGSEQDLEFHVYWHSTRNPFELAFTEANFAILKFNNKQGVYILEKPMQIAAYGTEAYGDVVRNILRVHVASRETVDLYGKYIYQISLKDEHGETEIPNQGIFMIAHNIHKQFVTR